MLKEYRNELGQLHREDGPAYKDDYIKSWWINGKPHRSWKNFQQEDGPAIEYSDGYKEWYINGKRHREDGPAIELSNGNKWWWLNGLNYYSEERYNEEIIEMKLKRLTELWEFLFLKKKGYF